MYTYVTVDGVVESPEEWQFPYYSQDVADFNVSQILDADAILVGRKTYEIFVGFWPQKRNNEFGIADKLNSMPKYVVSSTLDDASWGNSTVIRGDVAAEVAKLKEQAGSYLAVPGSLTLARSLMVSELRTWMATCGRSPGILRGRSRNSHRRWQGAPHSRGSAATTLPGGHTPGRLIVWNLITLDGVSRDREERGAGRRR